MAQTHVVRPITNGCVRLPRIATLLEKTMSTAKDIPATETRMREQRTDGADNRPLQRPVFDERRHIMLAAAAALFQEKGYGGTSMQDIAERVGLTKAALYYYVSSKQDILYQIHDAFVAELTDNTLAYFETHTAPLERLEFVVAEIIRTVARYKPYVAVAFQELRSLDEEHRAEIGARRDAYERIVEECVVAAIEAVATCGAEVPPRLVALYLFGACNWSSIEWVPR